MQRDEKLLFLIKCKYFKRNKKSGDIFYSNIFHRKRKVSIRRFNKINFEVIISLYTEDHNDYLNIEQQVSLFV